MLQGFCKQSPSGLRPLADRMSALLCLPFRVLINLISEVRFDLSLLMKVPGCMLGNTRD
jgi:hypothetical protein